MSLLYFLFRSKSILPGTNHLFIKLCLIAIIALQWQAPYAYGSNPADAGIVEVNALFHQGQNGFENVPIQVTIRNYGSSPINDVKLSWNIVDMDSTIERFHKDWTGFLAPDENITLVVGNYSFYPKDMYQLKIWTHNPNTEEDINHANDTAVIRDIITSPDKENYALYLDGGNDYVDIGGNPDFISPGTPGEYTVDMWIKLEKYQTGFVFGDEHSHNNGVMMQFDGNGYYQTYVSQNYYTSSFRPRLNKWYHIAQVQDAVGIHLYVNGRFYQTLVRNRFHRDRPDRIKIGVFYVGNNHHRFFKGMVDNIKIWNRAIKNIQDEMFIDNYEAGREDLVAFWDFNYDAETFPDKQTYTLNKAGTNIFDGILRNGTYLIKSDSPVSDWKGLKRNIALRDIISPIKQNCSFTDKERVTIVLSNNGKQNLSNLGVSYEIEGSGNVISENTGNRVIGPYDTMHYMFNVPANLSVADKKYTIKASVNLNGDSDKNDNIAEKKIIHTTSFIHIEGDTVICEGDGVMLTACCSDTIYWSNGMTGEQIWVTPETTTTYYARGGLEVFSGSRCANIDSITIQVASVPDTLPLIVANGPTTQCYGEEVLLSSNIKGDEGSTFIWNNNFNGRELKAGESGFYSYSYTSPGGCTVNSDTIEVKVLPQIYLEPKEVLPVCKGTTLELSVKNADKCQWSNGENFHTISVTLDDTTVYSVEANNAFGCVYKDSLTIEVFPETTLEIKGDTTICSGEITKLEAVASGGEFKWSTGGVGSRISVKPTQTQKYGVRQVNTYGCVYTDSIEVIVFPLPQKPVISLNGPPIRCEGESVALSSDIPENIKWSTRQTAPNITIRHNRNVFVTHTNIMGCESNSDVVEVRFKRVPKLSPQNRTTICDGESTKLSVTNATSVLWSTGDSLSSITVSPEQNTTYSYTAENTPYCKTTNSVGVTVIKQKEVGAITNLLPADSSETVSKPIPFSWTVVENAVNYDLFIWPPDSSYQVAIKGIDRINYFFGDKENKLKYGETYNWQLVARNCKYSNRGPVQQFTLRELPDIIVKNVQMPVSAFSGQEIEVSWTIHNIGKGRTTESWHSYAYLSTDTIFDMGDDNLGGIANLSYLEPGESYVQTLTANLPNGIDDNFYVIVKTDADGVLTESNDRNNRKPSESTMHVQLTPPPDLVVNDIVPPSMALSGTNVFITYSVTNQGPGPTKEHSWYDKVYLSNSKVWGEGKEVELGNFKHSGNLAKDSSYSKNVNVKIPPYISGNHYIFVVPDINNDVYEHANEQNNHSSASDSINIVLVPPADLTIERLRTNKVIVKNGEEIEIGWYTRNIGTAKTSDKWYDHVYLHNKKTARLGKAIKIGEKFHSKPLDLGESVYNSLRCKIPNSVYGTYYIYALADGLNQVFEMGKEKNNLYRFDSIQIITPDLAVENLMAPDADSSFSFIDISWTTVNSGEVGIDNKTVKHGIYISSDSSFNRSAILIDSVSEKIILPVNHPVQFTKKVRIPEGTSGKQYLYVVADFRNDIQEGINEGNNIAGRPIDIVLRPWSDLLLSDLHVADSAKAGYQLNVNYSVTNVGIARLNKRLWYDKIYLLNLEDEKCGIKCAKLLKTEQRFHSLDTGASLLFETNIEVPAGAESGWHQFIIVSDATEEIFENTGEPNIIKKLVYITKYPADLELTIVSAPDTARFGHKVTIEWTVKNISEVSSRGGRWTDELFISKDKSLNTKKDRRIGEWSYSGVLGPGKSYTIKKEAFVPLGITGENYLIMVNGNNKAPVDINRTNNMQVVPVHIMESPTPDLEITEFESPEVFTSGQKISMAYTVVNKGTADINGTPGSAGGTMPYIKGRQVWRDQVYLTTKTGQAVLNKKDMKLASYDNKIHLPVGESYGREVNVNIPGNIKGNFVLMLVTDASHRIFEYQGEGNNRYTIPVQVNLPPPCDLIVEDIEMPEVVKVGEEMAVHWSVKNISDNTVIGSKKDIVYLSEDKIPDSEDILFGTDVSDINLTAGQSQKQSLTTRLKGVTDGNYFVIVRTDVLNNVYEISDSNNVGYSVTPVRVNVTSVPFDSVFTDTLDNNIEQYYKLSIPDTLVGNSVLISLSGDSLYAQNQLYVAYNKMPTKGVHNFVSNAPYSAGQSVIIPAAQQGNYYIMVQGNNAIDSRQEIRLFAKKLDLELFSLVQNKGGNTGKVTVRLNGAKFGADLKVILKNASDTTPGSIDELRYVLTVDTLSEGRALYVHVDSLSNADGVYIRYGEDATKTNYDFEIVPPFQKDTNIIVHPLSAGKYYITVYQSAEKGNLGIGFNPPYTSTLEPVSGFDTASYIIPEKVEVINSTLAYATFDLTNKRTGMHHVILMSDGELFIAYDKFEVVEGTPLDLQFSMQHPSLVRSFEVFKYKIDFKNNGNIDIVSKEMILTSYERAPIGYGVEDLHKDIRQIIIQLTETNGPDNILRPGASGTAIIYTSAIMDALMCFGLEFPELSNK